MPCIGILHNIITIVHVPHAGRQEVSSVIAIGAGSAGGGVVLAVAIISGTVTVCLILKQRISKNNLSTQTVDYNSNRRLEQVHDVIVTDSNPAYNISTASHELEVVYYDAISPGKGTAEPPEDWDSDHNMLEENLAYESSTTAQVIAENQYYY